jgi:hypothetical protein
MLVSVIALVSVACTSSPSPGPNPGPTRAATRLHQSLNNGDLSLDYPMSWHSVRYERRSSFTTLLEYLTNQRLHPPCTDGSCAWPIDHLSPGGVLVSWSADGFPGWTLAKTRGKSTRVGNRPAKVLEQYPGSCRQIGGDVTITVDIPRPAAGNYYSMMACIREPGSTKATESIRDMLSSVRVKGI